MRQPDFDIDLAIGAQSELWVKDICDLMRKGNGEVEVKAPKPFLENESFYVEYRCQGRDGNWYPSGIATTKSRAFVFTFGSLPGGLIVETEWLKRATRLAYKNIGNHLSCMRGSNPTMGVAVSLKDLWETRDGEP